MSGTADTPDLASLLSVLQRSQGGGQAPPANMLPFGAPDMADAVGAYGRMIADQRQRDVAAGLIDPATGWPTRQGAVQSAMGTALGLGTSDLPFGGIRAYHGSPHSFDAFDASKIGTGEGAQAYGHGLYFAENEGVAKGYRDELAGQKLTFPSQAAQDLFSQLPQPHQDIIQRKLQYGAKPSEIRDFLTSLADGAQRQADYVAQGGRGSVNYGPDEQATADAATKLAAMRSMPKSVPAGSMYEVNIGADPQHFLDWDKPLSEQSQHVQDALANHGLPQDPGFAPTDTVPQALQKAHYALYDSKSGAPLDNVNRSEDYLRAAGIPGIRYLDAGSRGAGQGTSNYVVFDPATINILRKYGIAGLGLGLGAAATQGNNR